MIEKTYFKQETAAATDVNGTTWVDLLTKTNLAKQTQICGFNVLVAGSWAGKAKIRIVDGDGNKLFPFLAEYIEGTHFFSNTQVDFNFPVVVPYNKGYKFQIRSSDSADGAGETVELLNLDAIEGDILGYGVGALTCTWTQKDNFDNPISDVQVWLTSDIGGANVVAGVLLTNEEGEVTFLLDAGTYYVWREKVNYTFTNPQTWVVE